MTRLAAAVLLAQMLSVAGTDLSEAADLDRDAFVRVSPRDSRYFELSNGRPYLPIGFNLVSAPAMDELEPLIDKMAANGINYFRIWADQPPWCVETRKSGEYGGDGLANFKRLLTLCRQHGIRVKICLEHFRDIRPQRTRWSDRPLHHRSNGGAFDTMTEFLESQQGIDQFKRKIAWYAEHIGDEPAVFAWELWNEMNAVRGPWAPWTEIMLPELRSRFPRNLVIQSLGSFDRDSSRDPYRQLCLMTGNDIAQVHRYLDLGAQLRTCHGPADLLAADAVAELQAFHSKKPIILTETGAVKPKHTGCSELYAMDADGQLLHDMLFAPFFAGAAGPGHVWWWRQAVEQPDLWNHFERFRKLLKDIDPPAEEFKPVRHQQGDLRVCALQGKSTLLVWCRDARNDWRSELVDGLKPRTVTKTTIQATRYDVDVTHATVRTLNPWNGQWSELTPSGAEILLPDFQRSIVLRVDL